MVRNRSRRILLLGPLAIALAGSFLSGCLEMKATINAEGGAEIEMRVANLNADGDRRMRAQLRSPSVELMSAEFTDGTGIYKLKVRDLRKLRTAPVFRHVRVEFSGAETLRRTLDLSIPRRERTTTETNLPPPDYVVIDLTLSMPGAIVETNGTTVDANTAQWKLRIPDMLGKGSFKMHTVYQMETRNGGGANGTAATP